MTEPLELLPPPAAVVERGCIRFGRYLGAIPIVNVGRPRDRLRLKEWHYTSVTTERHFVAFAIVQLGYVANAFAYVVDRANPGAPRKMEALLPFGRGVVFARSSIDGRTRYVHGGDRITIDYRDDGHRVDIDLGIEGKRLSGSFECKDGGPGLALVHPLDPMRAAYTHKVAGYHVTGRLELGGEPILPAQGALGTLDWTRSLADRTTRWKWASFAMPGPGGVPLGLNLSAEVYDDRQGDSRENAFFEGTTVTPLHGVRFELPRDPQTGTWRIRSRAGDEVDLAFQPLGARGQELDLGFIASRFVQPYGVFRGRVLGKNVDGAFGVVEDHLSVW